MIKIKYYIIYILTDVLILLWTKLTFKRFPSPASITPLLQRIQFVCPHESFLIGINLPLN